MWSFPQACLCGGDVPAAGAGGQSRSASPAVMAANSCLVPGAGRIEDSRVGHDTQHAAQHEIRYAEHLGTVQGVLQPGAALSALPVQFGSFGWCEESR